MDASRTQTSVLPTHTENVNPIATTSDDDENISKSFQERTNKIIGISMVVILCASQVGAALTSQMAVQEFHAPFFLMWIHTLMMIAMWPLGLILALAMPSRFHNDVHNNDARSSELTLPRADEPPEKTELLYQVSWARQRFQVILCTMPLFYTLWVVANYCYVSALRFVPASTMVSIFGSCTAFVVIGERLFLRDKPFTLVRLVAVLLTVAAVVAYGLMSRSETERASTKSSRLFAGVLLGTASSVAAATYKVSFKKVFGNPAPIDVCLFLSTLGLVNLLIGAIPVIVLATNGVETPFWKSGLSVATWGIVWGSSVLVLLFNAAIAFGIAFTSPLFISIGTVLTIPVTAIVDVLSRRTTLGAGQIAASTAIAFSFVLIAWFDRHSVSKETETLQFDADTAVDDKPEGDSDS